MRSREEPSTKEDLELRKRRLQLDLAAVELELRRLSFREEELKHFKSSPTKIFPLGSRVKINNKRDPAGLHQQVATVTGHTKARVKVTANGIEYLRAPSSLLLQNE